jgi:hypothetical protein
MPTDIELKVRVNDLEGGASASCEVNQPKTPRVGAGGHFLQKPDETVETSDHVTRSG